MDAITPREIQYLRELAKKQMEYAHLPIMEERKRLWYDHNAVMRKKPVVVMEELSFQQDLLPPSQCETPLAKELEYTMQMAIINHELVGDDKVTPDFCRLNRAIEFREFDEDWETIRPAEESIAYQYEPIIQDLDEDFPKLKHSVYRYDPEVDRIRMEMAQDAIGDCIPVVFGNNSLEWHIMPSNKAEKLMGLETMLIEMASNPDGYRQLMEFLVQDIQRFLDWQEANGLLVMNNGNTYAGAGSYGFTHELQQTGDKVVTQNLWANMNSQESSTISPQMYGELVFPYYKELASRFGLVYYGCCEPVDAIWEPYLSTLPNLRKVSCSAWCNEEIMGDALRKVPVIYSRKPSPNFLGVGRDLDEEAFRDYIAHTLRVAKGCEIEFIFRDIYTLEGNQGKVKRAVQIVRELIETMY